MKMYEQVGSNREIFDKVTKIFYDAVFEDPWLGQFFAGQDQKHLEKQQSDFMIQNMGGPKMYSGKFPAPAHQHMLITEELFEHRHQMLETALDEAGVSKEFKEMWLRIDSAFKASIVKKSIQDCEKRFNTDEFLHFENPNKKAA